MSGNAIDNERLHTNSNTKESESFEPASQETGDADPSEPQSASISEDMRSGDVLPLGLVLEACPDIREYGPNGRIQSWADLLQAAERVRPMLGISSDAWRAARAVLPDAVLAAVLASILQKSEHSSEACVVVSATGAASTMVNGSPAIRSAGGYLRALTQKAVAGRFSPGPVLMALIGQRLRARLARNQAAAH
jgi:replication initiation protein RepC